MSILNELRELTEKAISKKHLDSELKKKTIKEHLLKNARKIAQDCGNQMVVIIKNDNLTNSSFFIQHVLTDRKSILSDKASYVKNLSCFEVYKINGFQCVFIENDELTISITDHILKEWEQDGFELKGDLAHDNLVYLKW